MGISTLLPPGEAPRPGRLRGVAATIVLAAVSLPGVSAMPASVGRPGPDSGTAAVDSAFVRREGAVFVRDGVPFRAAGTNCYYLMTYAADPGLRGHVDEVLDEAALMGLNVVRTWAFNDGGGWNALQTAPGIYDETVFRGLDYVLDRCSRLGLRVILPLVNNWTDYGGMDQYVAWSPTASFHDDFYTDPACRGWYRDHVAAVAARVNTFNGRTYRDDPAILAWELANEPRCPSDPSGSTLQAWIDEMSAYLKGVDPVHLVGTGSEGFYHDVDGTAWYLDGSRGTDYLQNHGGRFVDFAGSHSWPDSWEIGTSAAIGLLTRQVWEAAHVLEKPFILCEFGKVRDEPAGFKENPHAARAHYDPATYFSPGTVPGPVPGAAPLKDAGERYPRVPLPARDAYGSPAGGSLVMALPSTGGRDRFYADCYRVLDGKDGDGAVYWAAYHDAYPDADGFGVYYPADSSTVALIQEFAGGMSGPPVKTVPPLSLGHPFPNPFVRFLSLPVTVRAGAGTVPVHAAVHDVQGRVVRTLFDGRLGPGEYGLPWTGVDARGTPVPAGVYFLRVWAGGAERTERAIRLRE